MNLFVVPADDANSDGEHSEPTGERMALGPGGRMDEDRLAELMRRSALGHEDAFAELYDLTSTA